MAKVVVITPQLDVGGVLAYYLKCAGHHVISKRSGDRALPTLLKSFEPLIVIMHPCDAGSESLRILDRIGDDVSGRLTRHRYIVLALPGSYREVLRAVGYHLEVTALMVPFDLEDLEAALEVVQRELEAEMAESRASALRDRWRVLGSGGSPQDPNAHAI